MERRLLGHNVHEGVMRGAGLMAAAAGRGSRWSLLVSSKMVLVLIDHLSPELVTMRRYIP